MSTLESIVIVGASLAGLRAAETLRAEGFAGSITVVGDEAHAPYDRPPLSKQVLRGEWDADRVGARRREQRGARPHLGAGRRGGRVSISRSASVALSDGRQLRFDGLVIACGAAPR